MKHIQLSGSEVMGLVAAGYRLAPSGDSLKTCRPDRLRHSLLHISDTLPCTQQKVKCFSPEDENIFPVTISPFAAQEKPDKLPVDKPGCLWLNDRNV